MAGDWIKMEITTPDKPEVYAIAEILGIDADAAFGKLFRVWSWFDQHTENGNAPSVTKNLIDRVASVIGFATAMEKVGWLNASKEEIYIPNFDRHNGKTAKKRALTRDRKRKHTVTHRERKGEQKSNAPSVAPSSLLSICSFKEIWSDFLEHRQQMKSPMTERAQAMALSKLEAAHESGEDVVAIVSKSIEMGWKGVFSEKDKTKKDKPADYTAGAI